MNISKNISSIRESKGIKQYQVAEFLGIEPPNYSRLEKRGDKLTVEQIEKIAEALGVSVKELIFGDKEENYSTLIEEKKHQVKKLVELNEQYLHTIKVLTGIVEDIKANSNAFEEKMQDFKATLSNDMSKLKTIELALTQILPESIESNDNMYLSYKETLLYCCTGLKDIYEKLTNDK